MHISVDLGDTVFNRSLPKVRVGKAEAFQLFPGALGILSGLAYAGHRISVISKIDRGAEARVSFSLFNAGLIPFIVDPNDVHFCFERSEKGAIASRIGTSVHIDDRIEGLNSIHEYGIPHKILYIGAHDERENGLLLSFEDIHVAKDWDQAGAIFRRIIKEGSLSQ